MSRLYEQDDILVLKLSGDDFDGDLRKAKEIAGRRYNPAEKVWEFPNDPDTLMKIAFTIEPELPAELRDKLKGVKAEITQELITPLPDDAALVVPWHARLAPKQRAGVDFLADHPHSLLCDEMGGGKTVQGQSAAIEAELRHPDWFAECDNLRLIVAPNSVTSHWERELQKWAGIDADDIHLITGDRPRRAAQLTAAIEASTDEGAATQWIIVNWEKLSIMPELAKIKWKAVIADEAHRAKNRKAQRTKALWKLKAPVQIAATGTPIMNDPGELWALLKWLRPEQYTSYWAFLANYAETYSGFKGKQVVIGVKNADSLRFELSDKMVRRTKRAIHDDIPEPFPPVERIIPMHPEQAKLYDEAVKDFWLEIAQDVHERKPEDEALPSPAALVELLERETVNLETLKLMIPNAAARLTRLRQIATSPAILGGPDKSGKLDAVIDTVTDAESGRPFVIFCWYKPAVELVVARLRAVKISAEGFSGDHTRDERSELAQAFQAGEFQVIVPTLSTGGEGIDLYRSSDPLLAESDWVPAINQQAIDRCDRKGQTNQVQAQFFRSSDTVDTGRLAPKQRLKAGIVSAILGE